MLSKVVLFGRLFSFSTLNVSFHSLLTCKVSAEKVKVKSLSRVRIFATPWTVAHNAPLSMGFPRQEYWSGLPFPSLGNLPDPGMEPVSPALADRFFTTEPPGTTPTPNVFPVILCKSPHWNDSVSSWMLDPCQFSSVAQSCLTLCDPMDCSTPGLPVHHQLLECTQTHVH